MQKDLGFSLDLFRSRGLDGMQKLSVFFSDVGSPQKLVARYGFKVNEWKSSYRVTFSDHPTIFHLEGLAVVENTLDEDWNNVNLVVVVGAPPLDSESTSDQGSMELLVKTLDGSQIRVCVNPKHSILSLKAKVGKKKGLGIFSFKLMFSGKPLEEGRLISDYTIANQSVVQMEAQSSSGTVLADNSSSKFVMAALHNLSFYPISIRVTAKRKQKACHRNFGPENLGPGGPKFPTNLGPAGPILPEIMVRVGNIGPLTGVYMYGPKFPAVSFTGNNGVCLGQCKYMQVIEYILHTKPE